MIPLLVAYAFAIAPPPVPSGQPKTIEIVKPPDDVVLSDLGTITLADRHSQRLSPEQFRALIVLLDRAQRGPLESLAIEHREGGFKSGFGPLPPYTHPPAPLTTAGFWSMGTTEFVQAGSVIGGGGGFGGGPGRYGGGGLGGSGSGGGRGGAGGGRGGR